jgi:tRNA-specific 2-thiouridylase
MPIGVLQKPAVRELARKYGLSTAEKKDSQGICFVGKVGIKEFLQQFVPAGTDGTGPGDIIDHSSGQGAGRRIGEHDGALYYTIGQRHGLDVGGGLPYYVTGKDMAKNEVYVTTDLDDPELWSQELTLSSEHWINNPPLKNKEYFVRTRYRAPLVKCFVSRSAYEAELVLDLDEEVRAVTPGQSAVLYEADLASGTDSYRVVGGGIVT